MRSQRFDGAHLAQYLINIVIHAAYPPSTY
jgi:hypothetical protein